MAAFDINHLPRRSRNIFNCIRVWFFCVVLHFTVSFLVVEWKCRPKTLLLDCFNVCVSNECFCSNYINVRLTCYSIRHIYINIDIDNKGYKQLHKSNKNCIDLKSPTLDRIFQNKIKVL